MPCSQPGPAVSVNVPQYVAPAPPTPGAPRVVSIAVQDENTAYVTIEWSAVPGADLYRVYVNGSYVPGSSIGVPRIMLTLRPGRTYSVAVQACRLDGNCSSVGPSTTVDVPVYTQPQLCPDPTTDPTPVRNYFEGCGCVVQWPGASGDPNTATIINPKTGMRYEVVGSVGSDGRLYIPKALAIFIRDFLGPCR